VVQIAKKAINFTTFIAFLCWSTSKWSSYAWFLKKELFWLKRKQLHSSRGEDCWQFEPLYVMWQYFNWLTTFWFISWKIYFQIFWLKYNFMQSFQLHAKQHVPQADEKFYVRHLNCSFATRSLDLTSSGRLKEEITEVLRNCFSEVDKLVGSLYISPAYFTREDHAWILLAQRLTESFVQLAFNIWVLMIVCFHSLAADPASARKTWAHSYSKFQYASCQAIAKVLVGVGKRRYVLVQGRRISWDKHVLQMSCILFGFWPCCTSVSMLFGNIIQFLAHLISIPRDKPVHRRCFGSSMLTLSMVSIIDTNMPASGRPGLIRAYMM